MRWPARYMTPDDGCWIEIGQRGRYYGKQRIHQFLLDPDDPFPEGFQLSDTWGAGAPCG